MEKNVEDDKIVELYLNGCSLNKLEKICGYSRKTIRNKLVISNVKIRNIKEALKHCPRKHVKVNEKEILDIIDKYNNNTKISEIAKVYNMTNKGILYVLHKRGVNIRPNYGENRKYIINEKFFEDISHEAPSYFLGFLFSDGYNCTDKGQISVSQSVKNKDIIKKFKKYISIDGKLPIKKYFKQACGFRKKDTIAYTLLICSKIMSSNLKNLGCVQRKTNIAEFPIRILGDSIKHFIRGYLDGDGNVFFKESKGIVMVSMTGTLLFTKTMAMHIRMVLGIDAKISKEHRCKDNIKKLLINKRELSIKFMDWLYQDATIYGDRKYKTYRRVKEIYGTA
jgi:hypothetical protein